MKAKKLLSKVLTQYGKIPDFIYFPGDMASISAFFKYMKRNYDKANIDDVTWFDLDMEKVFKRINMGLSNSGEQYLYYMLRSPATNEQEYAHRKEIINFIKQNPKLRNVLMYHFAQLGRRSNVNIYELFSLESIKYKNLLFYFLLVILFIAILLIAITTHYAPAVLSLFVLMFINTVIHFRAKAHDGWKITTFNYCSAMVMTIKQLFGIKDSQLSAYLEPAKGAYKNIRKLLKLGYSSPILDEIAELFNSIFFIDLILYEMGKNYLVLHINDFFAIHKAIGELDAAISIASYQESVSKVCWPKIDFTLSPPHINCRDIMHPLVPECIPNSFNMTSCFLLTGSNASGKTTFLRTVSLNLILAQSICTALATHFECTNLKILTSIDITDDILAGESYYVSELKSIIRVFKAIETSTIPVFCCFDEILKGTNAVERIAAATEILKYLSGKCLCIAATHDLELCSLLDGYTLYHFEEHIENSKMSFDYKLRTGYSMSSNAIHLLSIMKFPPIIVNQAKRRAENYLKTKQWGNLNDKIL